MGFESIEAFFRRWTPRWAVGGLVVALALRFLFDSVAWLGYWLAGATAPAAIVLSLFLALHPNTLRTTEELGFGSEWDRGWYDQWGEGTPGGVWLLIFVAVIVAFAVGFFEGSGPGTLAGSILFLLFAYAGIVSKYPADREDRISPSDGK